MERFILKKLLAWKNSPYRKPLILKGVRQVGKTWILKEFGRRYYENTAYFNFDENEEYKQFFETTKDVDRILQNLMLASGQKIVPEKTLIIFDEVQDCPKVINSMKYFCENAPQYHVACAGSLLGIALAKPSSFPVGKVNFMQIDPMTFNEFLLANGDENLAQYLEQVDTLEPIPDAFFNPLYAHLWDAMHGNASVWFDWYTGLGTMGYGLGACIGAKVGRKDKTVVNTVANNNFLYIVASLFLL